jgi:protein SDA1
MVESGMQSAVVGDKGKARNGAGQKQTGGEAMWAVMMVRELWKKSVWKDAKTVSIVSLATFHPNTKVQAAAMHFFLGSEDDENEDEDEEDEVREARKDVKKMEHRLEVGKAGRKKEKALKLAKREANKVCFSLRMLFRDELMEVEGQEKG